jgi:hypothetical protein
MTTQAEDQPLLHPSTKEFEKQGLSSVVFQE